MFFSDLLQLSIMISKSIYVAENGITLFYSFLWPSNIPLCVCVCVCKYHIFIHSSVNEHLGCFHVFSSVAQSCPTLCDPMNRSTPGLPVHHQLPEFTQIHVHQVSDAIQLSHPLSSPSPPAPSPSQHQNLFQ